MEVTISRVIGLKNFLNKIPNESSVNNDINELIEKPSGAKVLKYENGKYFFWDQVLHMRVSKEYDYVDPIINGFASVRNKDKWGIVNNKGEEIVEPKYASIGGFSDGLCLVKKTAIYGQRKYGYIDTNGNEVIKAKYIFARPFSDERAIVQTRTGKYAVINQEGYLVSKEYDSITDYKEGLAIVCITKNHIDKYGVIDKNGHEIVDLCYDKIEPFENGYAIVRESLFQGIINRSGEEVVVPSYSEIHFFSDKAIIKNFDSYALIKLGENVVPGIKFIPKFKYNFLEFYDNKMGRFKCDNRWGLIDINGNEITFPKYDMITKLDNGLFEVKLNHKYGCIDEKGNEVIKPSYDDIKVQNDEYIRIKSNDRYGLVTTSGLVIADPIYKLITVDEKKIHCILPSSTNPDNAGNSISVLKEEISYDIIIQSKNGRIERKFDTLEEQQNYYYFLKLEVDKVNEVARQRREAIEKELNLKEQDEFNSLREKVKSM